MCFSSLRAVVKTFLLPYHAEVNITEFLDGWSGVAPAILNT
jgi:hypothetical protein